MMREQHIKSFLATSGFADAQLQPLAGDASFRRYIRVLGKKQAMLMDAPPEKEDVQPFVAIANYLTKSGYSAPHILAVDAPNGLVLLEDLGDDTFTRILKQNNTDEQKLYEVAVDVLAQWHKAGGQFSNPKLLPLPFYDETLLMREIQLFSDWYLPQVLGIARARELKAEYLQLWKHILSTSPLATDCFVHRDYHADNLMWLPTRSGEKRAGLLDFQDGVYGDPAYDMVSLLEDARRDVPEKLVQFMIARYLTTTKADKMRFMTAYAILGAQRNSKIVGIFVRLAARDNKENYLSYLPRVWKHLERDLAHPALGALKTWTDKHIPNEYRGAIALRYTAQELALSA